MQDIQLSPHFKLSEFTNSATASKYHIDNSLSESHPIEAAIIDNLRKLCIHVLEPLRSYVNSPEYKQSLSLSLSQEIPITIGSGYRCTQLNKLVGGVPHSMHLTGHAADIHIPDTKTGRKWMEWIIDNCEFYKIIWETSDKKHFWIHVSYLEGENLNHVVSYLLKSTKSPNR